jgi:type IV pilus assembly protein PilN
MIKINLIAEGRKPVVARQQRPSGGAPKVPFVAGENIALWMLLAGLLVGLGVLAFYFLTLRGTINDNEQQIREARKQVEELREIIRQVEEFERKEAELNKKIQVIQQLKDNQRGPVDTMDAISRSLPDLLWLDRMDMRGERVTLSGRAFNWNAIATFIQNLDDSPAFGEPNLRDINQSRDVFNFGIELTKAPKEPPPGAAGTTPPPPPAAAPAKRAGRPARPR